jgi:hypothetical protein
MVSLQAEFCERRENTPFQYGVYMKSATFGWGIALVLCSGINPGIGIAQESSDNALQDNELGAVNSQRRSVLGEGSFDVGRDGVDQLFIGSGNLSDDGSINSSSTLILPSSSLDFSGATSGNVLNAGGGAGGFSGGGGAGGSGGFGGQ